MYSTSYTSYFIQPIDIRLLVYFRSVIRFSNFPSVNFCTLCSSTRLIALSPVVQGTVPLRQREAMYDLPTSFSEILFFLNKIKFNKTRILNIFISITKFFLFTTCIRNAEITRLIAVVKIKQGVSKTGHQNSEVGLRHTFWGYCFNLPSNCLGI